MVWRPRSPLPHGLERLQRILELFHLQVLTPAVNLAKAALRGRARKATATARCLSGRISALWLACIVHSDPLRKKIFCFLCPCFTNRCGRSWKTVAVCYKYKRKRRWKRRLLLCPATYLWYAQVKQRFKYTRYLLKCGIRYNYSQLNNFS